MNRPLISLILVLLALLFIKGVSPSIFHPPEEINLSVLQAEAFLHGHLDIPEKVHDVADYHGRYYVAFPPFPAVFLMPFVWAFGVATNVVLISVLLTILNIWLLYRILGLLEVDLNTTLWMIVGFFMGTAYWMAVKGSFGVWHFAHVVCVTALFLAIHEIFSQGRGWLVGIYVGMAILSRHMAAYTIVFLAYSLWFKHKNKGEILKFACCLALALLPYLWLNYTRFDNPFDSGYRYILQVGYLKERLDTYGLFNIAYFPFNFIYLFLEGFHVEFSGSSLMHLHCLDPFGTSITFASPFLFTAFWAKWSRGLLVTAWISIGLIVLHTLFYYTNGFYQVNAHRFTLDFLPLLIVLTSLGALRCNPKIWKFLIIYAVVLNQLASIVCSFSK